MKMMLGRRALPDSRWAIGSESISRAVSGPAGVPAREARSKVRVDLSSFAGMPRLLPGLRLVGGEGRADSRYSLQFPPLTRKAGQHAQVPLESVVHEQRRQGRDEGRWDGPA